MHRELLHLYGPLSINSFGLFIIVGLIVFSALLLADPKRDKLITTEQFFNALSLAILTALIGGRMLYVISDWQSLQSWWELFAFWRGGFSLLGAVITLLLVMPAYFKKYHIPIIPLLDLAAIYAPLLQSISRIGCFFAGCCFGMPTSLPFGIINSECGVDSFAHMPLHPTQLYSSFALLGIFLFMYCVAQSHFKKTGQLILIYLFLMSLERFTIDFWRGDRQMVSLPFLHHLSIPQLIALIIACAAAISFIYLTFYARPRRS